LRYVDDRCVCAEYPFCSQTHVCTSDADCSDLPQGVCVTPNVCTDCSPSPGLCTTRCCTPLVGHAQAPRRRMPRPLGRTASGR
jgi:hypothetical protein